MIELFTFATPNGQKASIMLEEVGLSYEVRIIDITKGEQKSASFLAVNPNGRIPAIVDHETATGRPRAVFESGAILLYLAEKSNSPLLPMDASSRAATIQWLMFQMGGVGPMFGQAAFFNRFADVDVPYAKQRYTAEATRLLSVLERQLANYRFLAGDSYTVADIATWPWVTAAETIGLSLEPFACVQRWQAEIAARPAVQAGRKIGEQASDK